MPDKASAHFQGKMAEAVKVIVRCRPLNSREKSLKCKVVVKMNEERGICTLQKPGASDDQAPKQFTFDGAYYMNSTTEQIYNDIAYPLVEGVVEGYNGTVFAYGQTGCGKSFSMQGIESPASQRGIIPRAFQHIFESVSVAENTKYLVHASYLEIYNEEVRDLLSKNIKENLEVKEHPDKGIYVRGLSMKPVGNVQDCEKIMAMGWKNRAVGATLMNADSSRSHSIFTIYLEACDTGIDGGDHIRAGKLNLVDLAGSERQGKTGATGERLREATKINLSLSALGNVISALVDGKAKHIPYRDSKLTRLLQDSLGGNTKTLMVSCLSPADNNYEETLSTLRYANRAKNIKNKPTINEDPKDALLREYQEEIKKLRALLAGKLGADGIKGPAPTSDPALLEGQSPNQVRQRIENAAAVAANEATLRKGITSSTSTTEVDFSATAAAEKDAAEARREKDEAVRMKKEYEEKLQEMKEQYEAEQISNAKLQEDIAQLKTQYEAHIAQEGLANQKTLTMERLTQEQEASASCAVAGGNDKNEAVVNSAQISELKEEEPPDMGTIIVEGLKKATEDSHPELKHRQAGQNKVATSEAEALEQKTTDAERSDQPVAVHKSASKEKAGDEQVMVAPKAGSKTVPGASSVEVALSAAEATVKTAVGKINEEEIMRQHEEALKRLQTLQRNMIGGEKARDEELRKKRESREKHVDERVRQLAAATERGGEEEDELIFDVYASMQDQVKARDRAITRHKRRGEALKMEIEDLNYEFERDRSEYLATIRKQERDLKLMTEILRKIQPTVRRDCNYSNIDRIKSEAKYDEDSDKWSLPDILVTRTKLPNPNDKPHNNHPHAQFLNHHATQQRATSPKSTSPTDNNGYHQRNEEDRYLSRLKNRDGRLASNYFQPKRQLNQIIASSAHSDPGTRGGTGAGRYFPQQQGPQAGSYPNSTGEMSEVRYHSASSSSSATVYPSAHPMPPASSAPSPPPHSNGGSATSTSTDSSGAIEYQRRPHKLEALPAYPPPSGKRLSGGKKKKSKNPPVPPNPFERSIGGGVWPS